MRIPTPVTVALNRGWALGDIDWLRHQDRWAGLGSIALVEARRIVGESESLERRYYIRSLAPVAACLQQAVRGHWGITRYTGSWMWGEDRRQIRKDHGAVKMSLLRRLTLIRQEQTLKWSLQGRRKRAGWDNRYLEKVLGI